MSELITPLPRPARPLLADVVPALRDRTAVLVISGALLLAAASQVRIPLGFTPVPINLGTFAAVLLGGALGARRGAASTSLSSSPGSSDYRSSPTGTAAGRTSPARPAATCCATR